MSHALHSTGQFGRRDKRDKRGKHGQRGTSLLEALLAFAVLAGGALSMSALQQHMHAHADVARQRSEAVRIAQQDIESMRSFATLHGAADADIGADVGADTGAAYDQIHDANTSIDALNGAALNAAYQLTRRIDTTGDATTDAGETLRLKSVHTSVSWTARDGSVQRAALSTAIAGSHPALVAALGLASNASLGGVGAAGAALAGGVRPASIDLGNGRSAFKPSATGTVAWVFNQASGWVVESCDVPGHLTTADLRPEHLSACRERSALLLSGVIRFSNSRPPNAAEANDAPLGVAVSIAVSIPASADSAGAVSPASPWCQAEAQKTVQHPNRAATGTHRSAVPLAAVPADMGVADWIDLGERFVAYHCLVPVTVEAAQWSGVTTLVPMGWAIGLASTEHRVCRYTPDLDGNTSIERNDEHPAAYVAVRRTLLQQNFLVIAGDQTCPDGTTTRIDTASASIAVTTQHQP